MVRILDMLWVDHLEQLESLRESVNIRAYGQHEPLVEYRREAHNLFNQLSHAFEALVWNTVSPILETDFSKMNPAATGPNPPTGGLPPPEAKNIGRNDPCWCGSSKKYKKCHGQWG